MPNQDLSAKIDAAKKQISKAEAELRVLFEAQEAPHDEVVTIARATLTTAREHLVELDEMLAAAKLGEARSAVVDAEQNLRTVLDELVVPARTTSATEVVLDALSRLETAKLRLGDLEATPPSEEE